MTGRNLRGWTVFGLVALGAFLGGRAWAGGASGAHALTYSGLIEDENGDPLEGDRFIEVKLWRDDGGGKPAELLCTTNSQQVKLQRGRFSLALPADCRAEIEQHADVLVDVVVDGGSLGVQKVGAVPYAIEAQHAVSADGASQASGDLKATIEKTDTRLGALEATTAPAAIVKGFNDAVTAGATVPLAAIKAPLQYDLSWQLQHAAAAGACAAASPIGDSTAGHIVLPKPAGVDCANACVNNASGYLNCRTSIAVGKIRRTQATAYTDVVAKNYNYGCSDSQSNYDEVLGQGLDDNYNAYCCCYH